MSRGRPSENDEVLEKYTQNFHEFASKKVQGEGWHTQWFVDLLKSNTGPYKVEHNYPKGYKFTSPKIEKNKSYGRMPVSIVYKSSSKPKAPTKIKIFKNQNIDYILSCDKIVGIPSKAQILEIGVGYKVLKSYELKYNL